MHCSTNVGKNDEIALSFILSGTGMTTISADPNRGLIGDDEHGWSDEGIFNFEGGCYAKVIQLSETAEPEIYACTHMFGTILENVVLDPITRLIDLNDDKFTENTRASYPLEYITNAIPEKTGGHPKNIVLLTCDAQGVMHPIARLTWNKPCTTSYPVTPQKLATQRAAWERTRKLPSAPALAAYSWCILPCSMLTYLKRKSYGMTLISGG